MVGTRASPITNRMQVTVLENVAHKLHVGPLLWQKM